MVQHVQHVIQVIIYTNRQQELNSALLHVLMVCKMLKQIYVIRNNAHQVVINVRVRHHAQHVILDITYFMEVVHIV